MIRRRRSADGVAPTKLNTDAPATPAGLPRRFDAAESLSRSFAVHPLTEVIAKAGAADGRGTGVGVVLRTVMPTSGTAPADDPRQPSPSPARACAARAVIAWPPR